jgi:hypothetical protein
VASEGKWRARRPKLYTGEREGGRWSESQPQYAPGGEGLWSLMWFARLADVRAWDVHCARAGTMQDVAYARRENVRT